jgi:multicomponent Na+:H+ antiporter subunit E
VNILLINVVLALVWAALTGDFSPGGLSIGFILGYLVLYLIRGALGPTTYFAKVGQVLGFSGFVLWEIILANLRVARRVLLPRHTMQPRVIAVPLETCTDTEIAVLANLISLTPGTLSLDVSDDRCVLYVHVLYSPDAERSRQEIKSGFEQRILALMRNARQTGQGGTPR